MEDEDGDAEVANAAAGDDLLADTKIDSKRRQLNSVGASNTNEPLLLMAGTTNTLDTLFGEVSDSDSEPSHCEQGADNLAADENNVAVLSVKNDRPPTAAAESKDVEDGEITDSDSETGMVSSLALPSDKENATVSVTITKGGQAGAKQGGGNQQNTSVKTLDQSVSVLDAKSASHTPARRCISLEQERSASSGKKNHIHSDDRKSSPQFVRNGAKTNERWGHPTGRKSVDACRDDGTEFRSSGRSCDHRQMSPRKSDTWSRGRGSASSARFSLRGRRITRSRWRR